MHELIECFREYRNDEHGRNIILRAICASGQNVKREIEKILAPECENTYLKARPSTAPECENVYLKTAVPQPSKSNGDEMSKHAVEHVLDEAEAGQDEMTEQDDEHLSDEAAGVGEEVLSDDVEFSKEDDVEVSKENASSQKEACTRTKKGSKVQAVQAKHAGKTSSRVRNARSRKARWKAKRQHYKAFVDRLSLSIGLVASWYISARLASPALVHRVE